MENLVNLSRSFWKGRRVLLTGHTGFKGSWMLLLLKSLGAEVWGFSLPTNQNCRLFNSLTEKPGSRDDLCHHFEGDIRNLDAVKQVVTHAKPDVVIHFAAQALVRRSYLNPLETWSTNVIGSLNILEALRNFDKNISVVMITTDKVYRNREWVHGYRETDELGGHDPYSASKAATEIAIQSWRSSFASSRSNSDNNLRIASARSGNVIGGGDWSEDRIIPDAIRSVASNVTLQVRNPKSTRPWQHVLDPLFGYLLLAQNLDSSNSPLCEAFNFGPYIDSNRTVEDLLIEFSKHVPVKWVFSGNSLDFHESSLLHLQVDKAQNLLKWKPHWKFEETVRQTALWYKYVLNGSSPLDACLMNLEMYDED